MPKANILIVEDDEGISAHIESCLVRLGYSVAATMADGLAAVDWVKQTPPDLVLMDIVLQGDMDGVEAAQTIQSQFDVPIIFLSGYDDNIRRASVTMPYGYIRKPFEEIDLKIAVEMALHTAAVRAETKRVKKDLQNQLEFQQMLLDTVPAPIFYKDKTGRYLGGNRAWAEKIMGLPLENIVGRTVSELSTKIPKDLAEKYHEKDMTLINNAGTQLYEWEVQCADGTRRDFIFHKATFADQGGNVAGIIGAMLDVTELKNIEGQLLQAQKMEAVGALAAGLSHEVNNPVTAIALNMPILERVWMDILPLLSKHAADDPARKYGGLSYDYLKENIGQIMQDIRASTERIASLVNKLNNFARHADKIKMAAMHINPALENAIQLTQTTARKESVAIELVLTDGIPPMEGHQSSVEQIFVNLIINAIQAIDHSEGNITVTSGFNEAAGDIFVSVADNGRGIDPLIMDKIFDPFVTGEHSQGQTGLGLSVTHGLVLAHDGKIDFESRTGHGTTFTVRFPVKQTARAVKVLIVDDDQSVRRMLAKILQKHRSFRVYEAGGGIEAMVKLGKHQPDIMLLDIQMPDMDGLEVCRTLKASEDLPPVEVIIITGYPDDPKLKEITKLGITDLLKKPIEMEGLLETIDQVLQR